MKNIVIYGCGGMGREIAWLIEEINIQNHEWNILGYLDDDPEKEGKEFYNYKVIGKMPWIYDHPNTHCVVAIADCRVREKIVGKIMGYCKFPTLVHPNVRLNKSVSYDEGCMIHANTVFTTEISIGKHVFIHASSSIMHDVRIGDFSTIFLGANIAGGVTIDECVEIGSGATIIPYKNIGANSTVGAGAVVVHDIPANCTAIGVPARPIKIANKNSLDIS